MLMYVDAEALNLRSEPEISPEAEQLLQPVAVHAEASPRSALLLELERGRFVYRCERRGEWLAIMFPEAGEAIDCSLRAPERACAIGWVEGDLATAIFG